MQSIPSWTNARADALRQALRMTSESCADHLGLSVRTVAYWRERPDSIPQQRTQEILDAALERASDQAKERFARLLVGGPGSVQHSARCDIVQDAAGLPAEPVHLVALIDDLIGADMADRQEIAQAGWRPGTASSVITGYLFSSPSWHHEQTLLTATPNTVAARIRSVVTPGEPLEVNENRLAITEHQVLHVCVTVRWRKRKRIAEV